MDPETLIGQQIGQYQVEQHIGQGSVADVYLALDVGLNRYVALKVMQADVSFEADLTARFHREAQAVARLNHQNIVQIYTAGVTPAHQPYLAMQHIEGGTLQQKLLHLSSQSLQMTTTVALDMAKQVARALEAAHTAGIVHGDLKPSNILMRNDATVVVSDLGVPAVQEASTRVMDAKQLEDKILAATSYMSPEQRARRKVDGRSDFYSLGLVLYEVIVGKQPQRSPKRATTSRLRKDRPGLTDNTYRLIETCLQENPDDRYQTAEELIGSLEQASAAEQLDQFTAPSPQSAETRLLNKRYAWVGALLLVGIVLAVLTATDVLSPFSPSETDIVASSSGLDSGITQSTETPTAQPTGAPVPAITSAGSSATATQMLTSTPLSPTNTPTTESPTPTETLEPETLLSTPGVTPVVVTTCLRPAFFQSAWEVRPQLGCPVTAFTSDFTFQIFAGGMMAWQKRPTPSTIYAVFNDGTWQQQADPGGPPAPPCPEAEQNGDLGPIFGFGTVWCETPIWQEKLGRPTTKEQAAENNPVQQFDNGWILSVGPPGSFILYAEGRWERFAGDALPPEASPTPTPPVCLFLPAARWATTLYVTYQNRLGCPTSNVVHTQSAYQLYQGGLMVWRNDANLVYTLYYDGTYAVYDISTAINREYGENLKGSFGWLWTTNALVRSRLGTPIDREWIANDFAVQEFSAGTIIYFMENGAQNYVLMTDQAVWIASD
jgi:serine/threonine-protein kinase